MIAPLPEIYILWVGLACYAIGAVVSWQNTIAWDRRETAVLAALSALSQGNPRGAIKAVGLCSQVNTHVFVDAAGNALMPALTWQDGRCEREAFDLDSQVSEEDKLRWWGAPLPIDASHVLARMAHVQKHHPHIWQQTRWVLAPKDYCIMQLTGAVVADPMTSFGIIDGTL